MQLRTRLEKLEKQQGVRRRLPTEITVHIAQVGEEIYLCYGQPWEIIKAINPKTYGLFDYIEFNSKYFYEKRNVGVFNFAIIWTEETREQVKQNKLQIPIDLLVGCCVIEHYFENVAPREEKVFIQ